MPYLPAIEASLSTIWNAPDSLARQQLLATPFIAHTVPVTHTVSTRPDEPLIALAPRTRAIHDALSLFVPNGGADRSAVDLGCLEGGLSFELRRAGLNVLGVEGREDNYQRCLLLKAYYAALGGLDFHLGDVRDFRPGRTFDVVVCSGLLYHLDDPAAYIQQLGALTSDGGLLYLDTHVAPEDSDLAESIFRPNLSPIKTATLGGQDVRFRTYEEDVSLPESSIGNRQSVWMDTPSHLGLLHAAGFHRVFDMSGYYGADEQVLKRRYHRRYFAALKGVV